MRLFFSECSISIKSLAKLLVIALLFSTVLSAASLFVNRVADNLRLVEPFTIGIINEDDSFYVRVILNLFNSNTAVNNLVTAELMSLEDARERINGTELAAYVVVPYGFTESIMVGVNKPLTIICNNKMPLESSIIALIAGSGVSFLTTSQSGIYATVQFVYAMGESADFVNEKIIFPVNVKYAGLLLGYDNYFLTTMLPLTGELKVLDYYIRAFFFFFLTLALILFYSGCKDFFSPQLLDRYKINNIPFYQVLLNKQISLFFVMLIAFLPFCHIYSFAFPAVILYLSSFLLFVSVYFPENSNGKLFIILFAFLNLFFSGGIIPLSLFPNSLQLISHVTVNYYVVFYEQKHFFIFAFSFFFILLSALKLRRAYYFE